MAEKRVRLSFAVMRLLVSLSLAAALMLSACGDDEAPIEPIEATTTPEAGLSEPATAEEFVSAADPLCADALEAIAGLEGGTSAGSLSLQASQERQLTEGLIAELEALGPPAEPAISDFLAALEEQVVLLREREAAAETDDTVTFEALAGDLSQAKADALDAAAEAGFEECGEDGVSVEPGDDTTTSPSENGGTTVPAPTPTPAPTPVPAPVPVPPADDGGGTGTTPPAPPSDGSTGGIGPG